MIAWQGRILGAFLGFLLTGGHPLGLFLGFWFGHAFDRKGQIRPRVNRSFQEHAHQIFFKTTFLSMGHIAKAEGRVSEATISAARAIMNRMNLSSSQKQQAIHYFNQGKEASLNLHYCLDELQRACYNQPFLIKMFVEIQLQVAHADGSASQRKQRILNLLCRHLGVRRNSEEYSQSYKTYYHSNQSEDSQQNHHSSNRPYTTGASSLQEAFTTLKISDTANIAEIKRAYRKQMSQHHPDKLIAQGLSPSAIRSATDKTQKIQAAYEKIRAAKGF